MPARHSTPARPPATQSATSGSHGSPAATSSAAPRRARRRAWRSRTTVPGKPSSATTRFEPPASTSSGSPARSAVGHGIDRAPARCGLQVAAPRGRPRRRVVRSLSRTAPQGRDPRARVEGRSRMPLPALSLPRRPPARAVGRLRVRPGAPGRRLAVAARLGAGGGRQGQRHRAERHRGPARARGPRGRRARHDHPARAPRPAAHGGRAVSRRSWRSTPTPTSPTGCASWSTSTSPSRAGRRLAIASPWPPTAPCCAAAPSTACRSSPWPSPPPGDTLADKRALRAVGAAGGRTARAARQGHAASTPGPAA